MESSSTKANQADGVKGLISRYIEEGFKLLKLYPEDKQPVGKEWQLKPGLSLKQALAALDNGYSLGVQAGEVSGWIGCIDNDAPECVKLAPHFLPETLTSGKGGVPSHYVYRAEGLAYEAFDDLGDSDAERLIDIKASANGKGHQFVVAPSVHSSKGPYQWIGGFNPEAITRVDPDELREAVAQLAASALIARHLPDKTRHRYSLALAGYLLRNGLDEETTTKILCAAWRSKDAPHEGMEAVVRNVADTAEKLRDGEPVIGGGELGDMVRGMPRKLARFFGWKNSVRVIHGGGGKEQPAFNLTDLGNAQRLVRDHGHNLRYCWVWGKWLVWDGTRWTKDNSGQIYRLAKKTVASIYAAAAAAASDEERKAIAKHAMRSEGEGKIKAMVELAKSDVPITPGELDADPWLCNCQNGTIDLRTGTLREHRRGDFITKIAPVEYHPDATAPTFDGFLAGILPDGVLRKFVQRVFGYATAGVVTEEILVILHGVGSNGKTTLVNAAMEALGDYAMQAAPDLLLARRGSHPTELADLFGARFVACSESDEGSRLAEALVKHITGRDRIKARRMREDFWEFDPTHTVLLSTNHKPEIQGTDHAIWRRIRLVPFGVSIPKAEQDTKLPDKLRGELVGVLRWIVEGCIAWQQEGLGEPVEVIEATEQYRVSMDILAAFIADRCVIDEAAITPATPLHKAYKFWCADADERALNQRAFGMRLAERGFVSERITQGAHKGRKGWRGIGLRVNDEPPDDDPDDGPDDPEKPPEPPEGEAAVNKEDNRSPEESRIDKPETTDKHTSGEPSEPQNDIETSKLPRVAVMPELGSLGSLGSPEDDPETYSGRLESDDEVARFRALRRLGLGAGIARAKVIAERGGVVHVDSGAPYDIP